MTFHCRVATKDDFDLIVRFLQLPEVDNAFVLPLSARPLAIPERVEKRFQEGFWIIALNTENGEIVGMRAGVYHHDASKVIFSTLVVHPSYRGKRISFKICDLSISHATQTYKPKILAFDTWSTNLHTQKLAAHYSFEKVDEYDDPDKRPAGVQTVVYENRVL